MLKIESYLESCLITIEVLVRSILTKNIFIKPRDTINHFIHLFLYSSNAALIYPAKTDRCGYLDHNNCLKTWIIFGMVYRK